jgi:hypothetical protein
MCHQDYCVLVGAGSAGSAGGLRARERGSRRTGWDLGLAEGCLEGRRGRHFEREDLRIETVGVHAAA